MTTDELIAKARERWVYGTPIDRGGEMVGTAIMPPAIEEALDQ